MKTSYQPSYYSFLGGSAPGSAAEVIPIVREFIDPQSVVDVGCGAGGWLAEFTRLGVRDVFGLDGPWVKPSQLLIPQDRFQVADLTEPIRFGRRFDLVINLEVAEHLPSDRAETLVGSLVGLGDVILFSAAIPFQGGQNHVNEQWPDYWAQLFAKHGFSFVDCLRARIWTNQAVEWWYVQNIFLVVRDSQLGLNLRLAEAARENAGRPLSVVHPRSYVQSAARAKSPRELVLATLGAIKRSLRRRF